MLFAALALSSTQLIAANQVVFARQIATDFKPSLIPKASNLPGPTIDQQSTNTTRRILTESILPKYAVGLIGFVAAMSLLFLMIGGVRFATLYGNEEGIEKAKHQVIYALVGLLIALLSYTIVAIVTNLEFDEISSTTTISKYYSWKNFS